jgi:hypothetical protein
MFKSTFLLALVLGALLAGTGVPTQKAQAWHAWDRPYVARYHWGPSEYYPPGYRTYNAFYGRPHYAWRNRDPFYGDFYYRRGPHLAFRIGW